MPFDIGPSRWGFRSQRHLSQRTIGRPPPSRPCRPGAFRGYYASFIGIASLGLYGTCLWASCCMPQSRWSLLRLSGGKPNLWASALSGPPGGGNEHHVRELWPPRHQSARQAPPPQGRGADVFSKKPHVELE
eukprot:7147693-Pyramimonas_sp.AAC.1